MKKKTKEPMNEFYSYVSRLKDPKYSSEEIDDMARKMIKLEKRLEKQNPEIMEGVKERLNKLNHHKTTPRSHISIAMESPSKLKQTKTLEIWIKLRNAIVENNLKWAVKKAGKQTKKTRVEILDLIQAANEGLMKAATRYNPDKKGVEKASFTSYSAAWIKMEFHSFVSETAMIMSFSASEYFNNLQRLNSSERELTKQLKREPTTEEVEQATGLSSAFIADLRSIRSGGVSVYRFEEDGLLESNIPAESLDLDREIEKGSIAYGISALSGLEQKVIKEYYVQDISLAEIGRNTGRTRAAISLIHKRALKKLKKILDKGVQKHYEESNER